MVVLLDRRTAPPAVCVALAVGVAACGGSAASSGSDKAPPAAAVGRLTAPERLDRDGDKDGSPSRRYDVDDSEILAYGHAATGSRLAGVTMLMRRYLVAAASANGEEVCSLTYDLTDEAALEAYAQAHPSRPAGCAQALTEQLRNVHDQIAADVARLHVVGARLGTRRGYALLSAGRQAERYLMLHREDGAWKIDALMDSSLP